MRNKISILFKTIFAVLITVAILLKLGVFHGTFYTYVLFSFTNISSVIVLVVTVVTIVKNIGNECNISIGLSRARTIALILILITGLVYHFVLLPQKLLENPSYDVFTFGNLMAHYIASLGMLLDWLLFDKKGRIWKKEPLVALIIPITYFLIGTVYGLLGPTIGNKNTSYAYFFMDFENKVRYSRCF